MEKIASDLKASEMKQRDLSKAYEALHSQASSLLVLTIQWKDLEEHFNSTRDAIRTRFEELQEREKQLEAKESKFRLEIETKQDELFAVQKLVDEKVQEEMDLRRSLQKHREEIECEEKRVLDLQKLVVDKERESGLIDKRIQERTKKLNWVERRIEEKSNEVEAKWKELNKCHEDVRVKLEEVSVIDGAIKERQGKMESKQEEIKGAEMLMEELERRLKSKEEKLNWIEKSIEDSSKLANSKEEEVRVIRGSLNVYRESIKSKESELDAILESLEGKKKDIDVKEEQIKTLQRLIEGSEKELKLKEEKLREEALKVEEYSLRNREMEEWSCKLELKEREVELKEKQTASKMEELNSLSSELKVKEQQLKQEAEELELARKQCGVVAEVKIGKLEMAPANNVASSSASDQSNINITDSGTLQLCIDEHMERNDSMSNNISSLKFLQQESSEPAKLVLDAILQGFYPSNLTVENKESDLVLIRRTCIVLLEELKRVSSQVNPELREAAMKCASDWKGKMIVESERWLEILGFLWIVTTYELTSSYDGKELQHLLDVVAQHDQAMGLSLALDTTKKAPACSNISSPVKIEKPESQVANTEATISSLTTATTIDARHLQELQNEQFREAAYSAFKGIIYDLIVKKRLTEAVGLIYTVKLFDKFPPAQVLKEYVDNGRKCCQIRTRKKKLVDEKDKITDEHIADLRVVLQCIKDYKLESEYSPDIIETQIALSESIKKLRRVVPSVLEAGQQQKKPLKNVELQEQKKQKKDQPITSNAKLQEVEQKASMVEQQGQQQEQKTSMALEKVKQIASSKVEKQQQLKKQKASKVEQHEQKQEQKTSKAKLQEKAMQIASKKVEKNQQLQQQQERKVSTAKLQEKVEHTTSTKVENQQQLQKQEEKKTSMAKLQANAVQRASNKVAERQQQQELKTSKNNLQEKVVHQPSNRVQEQLQQQEHNASKVKQQQQQEQIAFQVKQQQINGNKRSSSTFAPRFDYQQQFDNKYQRTSTVADRPFRLHPDHPDYTNPSSSTWRHGSYGYQGQFHPATYNNYEAHANYGHPTQFGNNPGNGSSAYYGYGTGHNPRLNQSYDSYPGLPRRAPL